LRPVTVITGASAGIGSAFARVFAENGHETVLVARRLDRLDAVADAITAPSAAHGHPPPHTLAIDLLAAKGPERLMGELTTRGLEPAILVNNAGFGLRGAARDLDRAQQLAMVDLNMRVLTDLSLRCVPSLKRHRGGIINMASISSFFPGPGMAVYFASKAYVLSFSLALRQELAPHGVKVLAVCPGPVPSEFQAIAGIDENLPTLITHSADAVTRAAYDAFMHGRAVLVPGFANKGAALLPRLLPRGALLWLAERLQMRPAASRRAPIS
jgi:uncharacterized protein